MKLSWAGRLARDAPLNTTLLSYRSELEKRRDYGGHIWRRAGLTFCFQGLAMVIVPGLIRSLGHPGLLMKFVPIFALLALWFAMFFRLRKRNRQKLHREIEELRVFETENRYHEISFS